MSSGRPPAAGSTLPPSRERCWARPLLALAAVALIAGVPEIAVRLADPPLRQYRAMLFGDDPNSVLLFMEDPRLHWRLRPSVSVPFLGVRVRTGRQGFRGGDPAPGRPTVLCVGDSTPFGWRMREEEPFPAQLERRLGERGPGAGWQVVNAGVPGYSSHQARIFALGLIAQLRPRVVVVCVGNNDAWPARRTDREESESRAWRAALEGIAAHSRLFLYLADRVRRLSVPGLFPGEGSAPTSRVPSAEFPANVAAIARAARAAGAQVVVLTPPTNLFRAPFGELPVPGEEGRTRRAEQIIGEAARLGGAAGVAAADRWLADDPGDYLALWIKGISVFRAGDRRGGIALLEEALERHPWPQSCKPSWIRSLVQMTQQEQIPLVDFNAVLGDAAGGRAPEALYLDHCHPTAEGHRLIAEAVLRLIPPAPGSGR